MIERLDVNEWLKLNAQLQKRKNSLRKLLKTKGVLKKGGTNTYDKYNYFTEAQYKELFTELFSETGLELSFTELEYNTFEGSEKQANGRMPKLEFKLTDTETGFYETTIITGEGIDKGDKAGYKAYTGAIKYYLANTFLVATGDDPEKESPNNTMNKKNTTQQAKPQQAQKAQTQQAEVNTLATESQLDQIRTLAKEKGKEINEDSLKKLTVEKASQTITYLRSLEVPANE